MYKTLVLKTIARPNEFWLKKGKFLNDSTCCQFLNQHKIRNGRKDGYGIVIHFGNRSNQYYSLIAMQRIVSVFDVIWFGNTISNVCLDFSPTRSKYIVKRLNKFLLGFRQMFLQLSFFFAQEFLNNLFSIDLHRLIHCLDFITTLSEYIASHTPDTCLILDPIALTPFAHLAFNDIRLPFFANHTKVRFVLVVSGRKRLYVRIEPHILANIKLDNYILLNSSQLGISRSGRRNSR